MLYPFITSRFPVMGEINKDYYLSGGKNYEENEIRVGPNFQATIPPLRSRVVDMYELLTSSNKEWTMWEPSRISENAVIKFLDEVRRKSTRRLNEEELLFLLHQCEYDTVEAVRRFKLLPEPTTDAKMWTEKECKSFEKVLQYHGKKFHYVKKLVPDKSVKDVVEFYYFWKRSERYDAFINEKCILGQSRFKKKAKRKSNRSVDPADVILDEEQSVNEKRRQIYPVLRFMEVV